MTLRCLAIPGLGTPQQDYFSKTRPCVNQDRKIVERRGSDRFPIERDVRYRVMTRRPEDEVGNGLTVNMSSSGVLFTTDDQVLPGRRLEVAINWPAQLNNNCALRLVARGRVVRYEDGRAAMEIQQYEFRTAKAAATP